MALSDLERTIREHRAALIRGDRGAALVMAGHYRTALTGIEREIDRLTLRMERTQERGERLRPNWAYREQRLEALKQQATDQITRFTDAADGVIRQQQTRAVIQAQADVREVVVAQANPQTLQAAQALNTAWHSLPTGAVEDLAGALSNGSPLHTLLRTIPGQVAERMEATLIEGLSLGRGPRLIAADLRDAGGIAYGRALNISRTETIRAYRNSTSRAFEENEDVLNGWKWHATLDRCCIACYAMHGTYHPVGTTLDGHPSCRCAMVPVTKSWAEIGEAIGVDLKDVPDSSVDFPLGEDLFAGEKLARKIELIGVDGVDRWMKGEVIPADYVAVRTNKAWGSMRTARTPRQAAEAAEARRQREADALKAREARQKARAGAKATRTIKPGQGETWAMDADQTLDYLRTLDAELKAAIAAANDAKYAAQEKALRATERFGNLNHRLHNLGETLSAEEMAELAARREVMDAHYAAIDKAERQWRKLAQGRKKRLREALHAPPAERAEFDKVISRAKGDRLKEIEKGVQEFKSLVANRSMDGKRIWIEDKATSRAFYRAGEIHLDKQSPADVVVHELGHWLEDNDPALLQKLIDYRTSRIQPGETPTGRAGYPSEICWHDKWQSPYTGRIYESGGKHYATEVASMGLQEMYRDPIQFAIDDPDFFRLTLDTVMRGR